MSWFPNNKLWQDSKGLVWLCNSEKEWFWLSYIYIAPRCRGCPWNWVSTQGSEEPRMMGLPDGRKSFKIVLAVLIQYRRVTSSQPATQPRCRSKFRASKRRAGNKKLSWYWTRSSADADNRLDAFSGQSRSTNMVPFHMLYMVFYCAIVTLSLRRAVFTIFVFKKFHDP